MAAQPIITSRQHPVCKLVRALSSTRRQREHGLFVASGKNAVLAAIEAAWPLDRVIATDGDGENDWEAITRRAKVPLSLVEASLLAYLSDLPSTPEVLALARLPKPTAASLAAAGLTLVLDGIGDPGNMGTMIRTAAAAGVGAIVVSESSCDPFGVKAVRASAGSVFHLPPLSVADHAPAVLAARLQSEAVPIIIAAAHGGQNCFNYRWPRQCVLVLGHETRGVAAPWEAAATARVTIPLHGQAESLNVAAAGAVLLFAWRRQA